jgi:hypothetical protein
MREGGNSAGRRFCVGGKRPRGPDRKTSYKGLFIARTLVNVNDQDQVLGGGTTPDRYERVTPTASIHDLESQTQRTRGLCEQLQWVESDARPNLSTREAKKVEEFITEFQDIFAKKSDDYGRRDRVSIASTPATLVRS